MKRAFVLFLLLQMCAAEALAATAEVAGSVYNPGIHRLPPGSRLSRLALAAAPTPDAYVLGAALLREPKRLEQTRLKAGLMFDLEQLALDTEPDSTVGASVARISRWLKGLPVTGRVPYQLEPRVLEATRSRDFPVQAGDVLFYPARPSSITIVGAVSQQCTLAHIGLQEPTAYLGRCPKAAGASSDYVHVIQPDGHTARVGTALWNQSPPSSLAPGAVIFVPLAETLVRNKAPHFNEDAVSFLATQLLAAPGTSL
jgi:hypothetical protein